MKAERIIISLLLMSLLLSSGCVSFEEKEEKIVVVAFNKPLASIVKEIAKEKVEVITLVESDPHNFQLNPSKAYALERASLYVGNSKALESFSLSIKAKKLYAEDIYVEMYNKTSSNKHFWLELYVAKALAKEVANDLSKIDEKNAFFYKNNSIKFEKKIDSLIEYGKQKFSNKTKAYLLTHPSLEHFNRIFGLKAYYIFIHSSTSPKRIKEIIEKFEQGELKGIAIESHFSKQDVEFLLEELEKRNISYKIVNVDVLGYIKEDYYEMMRYNIEQIAEIV